MARVYVGVGSNVDRERNICGGIAALRDGFGPLAVSTVYEAPAVGFEGEAFYNLVVGFDTDMPPEQVQERLKAIEITHGRTRGCRRYAPRTLDLDLLLYGDAVIHRGELGIPREDITRYAFVLRPLAELAGDVRHPESGATFSQLWAAFDARRQPLQPVTAPWEGSP